MSQVSCRVLGVAFDAAATRGIAVERLVEGLPYTEEQLREPRRRIEWDVLVEVAGRLEALVGGADQLEQIGYRHLSTPSYGNVRRLAAFFTRPRDLYWLGTSWFGPNLFGITNDHVETLPDGRILEVIEIPEPYAPCSAIFHIIAGALRATPSMIGMPDAEIEADIGPRRASFVIRPPEPRFSLRRSLKQLVAFGSPRHFVRELSEQQDQLRHTNHTLEHTVRDLRESEARLTAIIELDSDVRYAIRIDPDGHRESIWVAGELASFQGAPARYDLEQSGGRVHPADRDEFDTRYERAVDGDVLRLRYRIDTPEGEQRWIQESIRIDPSDDGHRAGAAAEHGSVHYHGTLKDVTAEAQAQADLQRLVSAVDQANDGIAVVAPDFEVVYANSALHEILDREPGSLMGRHIAEGAIDDRGTQAIASLVEQVSKRGIGHERVEYETERGTPGVLDATVAAVYGGDEAPEGYVGIVRDITRELELEGQIRFADQMNALGQLAGGLAHDFNNLLMVIRADSELLLRRLAKESSAKESLDRISEATDQGGHLIQQLFTLSRIDTDRVQELELNDVASDFVSFVRGALAPHVKIELSRTEGIPAIRFGRGQLLQVLVNLAFNARDAMPDGGLITIATGTTDLDETRAAELAIAPGEHAWVSVRDSGQGMLPEVQRQIFEPLYSTKELGRGSGMGLTTSLRIMRQAGGAIEVSSELGRGSIFRLYFAEPAGAADEEPGAGPDPAPGGRR